jgi:hypothetical protein
MANEPRLIPADTLEGLRLRQMYDLARDVRGSFMEQAIWIDVVVTDILAQYFAPDKDKRMLLSSDVLAGPNSSFGDRIKLLEKVVSRSYRSFAQECPNLSDRLDKIRRFRNRLAHAHLDTSDEFIAKGHKDRIQITFYQDGTAKSQVVTVEESNNRLKECSAVMTQLLKLQALLAAASPT